MVTVVELISYPVKGCAGIPASEAELTPPASGTTAASWSSGRTACSAASARTPGWQ